VATHTAIVVRAVAARCFWGFDALRSAKMWSFATISTRIPKGELMIVSWRSVSASFLSYLAIALAPTFAFADDELNAKVRTAWEKFSELEETKLNYGERAEVALAMLEMERERLEVDAMARDYKIQIDSFPPRRTNLQQDVFDQWLLCRQRLSELDRNLALLKSRLQELNEIAIRNAQASGKRVQPLDRVGLLHELQRRYQECISAFDALRTALAEVASAQSRTPVQVFQGAINELEGAGDPAAHLVSSKQFQDAFRMFYGRQHSKKSKKSGRISRKFGSAH
jgi:hypothetical protein